MIKLQLSLQAKKIIIFYFVLVELGFSIFVAILSYFYFAKFFIVTVALLSIFYTFSFYYIKIYFKSFSVTIKSGELIITKGVIFKTVQKVDIKNIIIFNIEQSIFEFLFSVFNLKLTVKGASVTIKNINGEQVEIIRKAIKV